MAVFRDQIAFARSPRTWLEHLTHSNRPIWLGLRQVLIFSLLYEGAILLWALGADTVTLPAFLRISEETYYYYELIFLVPVFLCVWLLAAAIAYAFSRALGGSGSFDALLGGFGVSMAISAYFTLIPDYIQSVLWTTGLVPFAEYQRITGRGILLVVVWTYMLAYTVSHLVTYTIVVRRTQNLTPTRAAIAATVAFLVSFALQITFVR